MEIGWKKIHISMKLQQLFQELLEHTIKQLKSYT